MGSRSTCQSAEASLAGRLSATLALCAVLGSTVSCASVTACTSVVVALGYRECGAPDRTSVFELSVQQNGEVEYSGSIAANTAGKRAVRIDPQVARQIHKTIAFAVRESKKPYVPPPTAVAGGPDLCLTVRDATSQSARARPCSRRAGPRRARGPPARSRPTPRSRPRAGGLRPWNTRWMLSCCCAARAAW